MDEIESDDAGALSGFFDCTRNKNIETNKYNVIINKNGY